MSSEMYSLHCLSYKMSGTKRKRYILDRGKVDNESNCIVSTEYSEDYRLAD